MSQQISSCSSSSYASVAAGSTKISFPALKDAANIVTKKARKRIGILPRISQKSSKPDVSILALIPPLQIRPPASVGTSTSSSTSSPSKRHSKNAASKGGGKKSRSNNQQTYSAKSVSSTTASPTTAARSLQITAPSLIPRSPVVVSHTPKSYKILSAVINVYPQSLHAAFTRMPGNYDNFTSENFIKQKIKEYNDKRGPLSGSKFFIYHLLDAKAFKNLQKPTFVEFIHAMFYQGKATGNRPFEHLNEFVEVVTLKGNIANKNPDKIAAIADAVNNKGVIIHTSFFNCNETEAFVREGAIIKLLRTQLTNSQGGQFPALELNTKGTMYMNQKATRLKSNQRKYCVKSDELIDFAINTLIRSYKTFLCRIPYVITKDNMKSLIGSGYKLKDYGSNLFSSFSYIKTLGYSKVLELTINNPNRKPNESLISNIEDSFKDADPDPCFIAIFLDGSKIAVQTGTTEIGFDEYMGALIGISIASNFDTPYQYLARSSFEKGEIYEHIYSALKNDGILVQILFPMSPEKNVFTRKGAMLASVQAAFLHSSFQADFLKMAPFQSMEEVDEWGVMCWQMAWTSFKAQRPERLKLSDIY